MGAAGSVARKNGGGNNKPQRPNKQTNEDYKRTIEARDAIIAKFTNNIENTGVKAKTLSNIENPIAQSNLMQAIENNTGKQDNDDEVSELSFEGEELNAAHCNSRNSPVDSIKASQGKKLNEQELLMSMLISSPNHGNSPVDSIKLAKEKQLEGQKPLISTLMRSSSNNEINDIRENKGKTPYVPPSATPNFVNNLGRKKFNPENLLEKGRRSSYPISNEEKKSFVERVTSPVQNFTPFKEAVESNER